MPKKVKQATHVKRTVVIDGKEQEQVFCANPFLAQNPDFTPCDKDGNVVEVETPAPGKSLSQISAENEGADYAELHNRKAAAGMTPTVPAVVVEEKKPEPKPQPKPESKPEPKPKAKKKAPAKKEESE